MTKQKSRWLCGLMAAVMLFTYLAVPIPAHTTASAHWADASLSKLRDWGVMRGDQNGSMEPDRNITRSEFVSMVNRAFGYKKLGKQPFKDIAGTEWYANEVNVGFNQGYFKGSSASTASPNDSLTREEAAVLVGRNLMLTPDESENMIFKDGRKLSSWSRGIVTAAAKKGILKGQEDGTFRPQAPITRGEVASMLQRTIGTPINQSGRRTLGMVHGNVMISAPDVELYDTTINGDLYITAGVDLGFVKLNNVRVTGQIIAAGAGVSNRDGNSITLHNTAVAEMIIDSPNNVAISVRAEGDTNVGKAFVRTSAYLEDSCYNGKGFQAVEIDGEEGTRVDFTGNFKDVLLKSPKGMVALGRGSIKKLAVDEKAFGARVNIDVDAFINEMYLDTGTTVTGVGDVGYVKVNTAGTTMTMLPDKIEIRPGIVATVGGQQMTSKDAVLASTYPRILASYPKIKDIAPNAANSLVSTNKTGTMYWGITYKADKEISPEDLIKPPSYGGKALSTGQSSIQTAENDITTAIGGLKTDTEYMFSAVLKDARGNVSARKSRSFRTPDNTIPNFAQGYPRVDKDGYVDDDHSKDFYTAIEAVITKNSTLYYALYKKGLPAPTADELRTQTMSGQVKGANGKLPVEKNKPILFSIMGLEEQTEYDLYLLASDGINHSPMRKLSFKTGDHTPPEFNKDYPKSDNVREKSVDVKYSVNEDATVYWVAVKRGETYPVPPDDWKGGAVPLDSDEAKSQVMSGSNALVSGKANASKNREGKLTISGLEAQTGYDVYFVLQDRAGNLIKTVKTLQIKTLDVIAPTAELKFEPDVNEQPLVDSDISIVFSEEVRVVVDKDGKRKSLHEMKDKELIEAVNRNFAFYDMDKAFDNELKKDQYTAENVLCTLEEGKTVLTFKGGETNKRALPLLSGNKYQVRLSRDIYDTSNNKIDDKSRELEFTTIFSRIVQTKLKDRPENMHMAFELRPQSTDVADTIFFDLVFWSNSNINFELQQKKGDTGKWEDVTVNGKKVEGYVDENKAVSLYQILAKAAGEKDAKFEQLNKFTEPHSYAIKITKVNGRLVDEANRIVNVYSVPVAGNRLDLESLAKNPALNWDNLVGNGVTMVGTPPSLELMTVLVDTIIPAFEAPYPKFKVGDSVVIPQVRVTRNAVLYYVVAPEGALQPNPHVGNPPQSGEPQYTQPDLTSPIAQEIVNQNGGLPAGAVRGSFDGTDGNGIAPGGVYEFKIEGLKPKQKYDVYFVLKGVPQELSRVYYYQIETGEVTTPKLELRNDLSQPGGTQVSVYVDQNSDIDWKLYATPKLPKIIEKELPAGQQSAEFAMDDGSPLADIGKLVAGKEGNDTPWYGELSIADLKPDALGMMTKPVELKELKEEQTYIMVGLAQNQLGGKYVLYRLDNIMPSDVTPPIITSVFGQKPVPKKYGYSGKITVVFSEKLYYKEDRAAPHHPIMKANLTIGSPNYIVHPTGKNNSMIFDASNNGPYSSLSFSYNNLQIGEGLFFEPIIYDQDGNPAGQFSLILQENIFGNDPGFVATLGGSTESQSGGGGQTPPVQRVAQTTLFTATPRSLNMPTLLPSADAPVITDLTVDRLKEEGSKTGLYSAYVTIRFSKPLYYQHVSDMDIGKRYPMDASQWSTTPKDNEGFFASTLTEKTASANLYKGKYNVADGNKKAYYEVQLRIFKWEIGDGIYFTDIITDQNGERAGQLGLQLVANPDSSKLPYFEAQLGSSTRSSLRLPQHP